MRRFAVVSCLLLAASLVAPLGGHVAHAAGGTPIESIPVVRRSGVTSLSPSHADNFQGVTLDHGFHFISPSSIVLNLNGAYTELDATAYGVDQEGYNLIFQNVSDPTTGVQQLLNVRVAANAQSPIEINVRGVTRLSISEPDGVQFATIDLVGSLQDALPRYVAPTYPLPNTVIPTNTSVVFLWHGFPGASAYLLHVWLVKQSGTTAIGPTTHVFLSQLIFGHTSYTWDDRGFLPGTYQYDLLPLDRYGNALAGRSPSIQFTVSQSS